MIDQSKLLDALLNNQQFSDEVIIKNVEDIIAEGVPFKHSARTIIEACGITQPEDKDLKSINKDFDKVSQEVEALEKLFTKREMAFLLCFSKKKLASIRKALAITADILK